MAFDAMGYADCSRLASMPLECLLNKGHQEATSGLPAAHLFPSGWWCLWARSSWSFSGTWRGCHRCAGQGQATASSCSGMRRPLVRRHPCLACDWNRPFIHSSASHTVQSITAGTAPRALHAGGSVGGIPQLGTGGGRLLCRLLWVFCLLEQATTCVTVAEFTGRSAAAPCPAP